MVKKLFVGKLSYNTSDSQLQAHFQQAGNVVSAKVIIDRYTGQGKGFGFVEMATDEEAKQAITQLNNSTLDGRTIIVNEARPQEERGQRDNRDRQRSNRW